MRTFTYVATSEGMVYRIIKSYEIFKTKDSQLRFISEPYFHGTEEEIIFSRALEKYQDIVIFTIKNN